MSEAEVWKGRTANLAIATENWDLPAQIQLLALCAANF
jgi:hypothetical protein